MALYGFFSPYLFLTILLASQVSGMVSGMVDMAKLRDLSPERIADSDDARVHKEMII